MNSNNNDNNNNNNGNDYDDGNYQESNYTVMAMNPILNVINQDFMPINNSIENICASEAFEEDKIEAINAYSNRLRVEASRAMKKVETLRRSKNRRRMSFMSAMNNGNTSLAIGNGINGKNWTNNNMESMGFNNINNM